jgi:hypothetical protein
MVELLDSKLQLRDNPISRVAGAANATNPAADPFALFDPGKKPPRIVQ